MKKLFSKLVGVLGYKLIDKKTFKNQRYLNDHNLLNTGYILNNIFKNNDIKNLLQVGANDGRRFDDISKYIIDNQNLKAILVEPVKKYFNELKENYKNIKNVKFENAAISKDNEIKYLFCVNDKYLSRYDEHIKGINSYKIDHLLKHGVQKTHIDKVEVNTISFKSLFEKHQMNEIDILYIDTEGYDGFLVMDFLKKIDSRPIIIFEYYHIESEIFEKLVNELILEKYKFFGVNENIVCFRDNHIIL